ncbi:hypothetical protein ADUPG1_000547 [Aduncisulcus paluster]|uniref:Uncharacterized protein n=1 Tax=Aduncisulcus paluster TaxID=2918883 RepID=A0ABQ5K6R6_9EUKA|nr:hypothetical protein ADUPG1_000547 [Aduncisulcus paluster]
MSLSTDAVIQTVEPEFVLEVRVLDKMLPSSGCTYSPIPGDAPNIKSAELPTIKAIGIHEIDQQLHDQSSSAQLMMKGELNHGHFTHISIPFSSSSPMKGAYICLKVHLPPSHLIFTLTSSKGEKTSKKYEFPGIISGFDQRYHWYFLPVDLSDVVLCEITGRGIIVGIEGEIFHIKSLVFISREETTEEMKARETREKLWSEAPVVKPEFVKAGGFGSFDRKSIPIPRDDPRLVYPSFSMVKCKNDVYSKESRYYDLSSRAQKMLKGEGHGYRGWGPFSHLSIPFPSPSPLKGAYICGYKRFSSPCLLFTFTDCDGKKTSKKYEFTRPKYWYEWRFLPIDLPNVVLCEIEGKGRWNEKNSRIFGILSLVFSMPEEIAAERLSLLPWK